MNFEQIFEQISPEKMGENENIFTLAAGGFLITAGTAEHYNSMTGSGGGFGLFFRKPAAWCLIKTDRYTMELIENHHVYTLSYLPEEYKKQLVFLGTKSGRDSQKMQETELTAVQTPQGNIAFTEARLVFECRLLTVTTPTPENFYTQDAKDWLAETYKTTADYRKIVFGEIAAIWARR
jgi:flavin reductase (DIM6/NTAB) family NADH-FMN oxidoreductase RutF